MAAKPKIDWAIAKAMWESDERQGFDWLSNHYDGVVSRQAISKRAKAESWVKRNFKVAQLSKKSSKPEPKITRPNKQALIDAGYEVSLIGRDTLYKIDYNKQAYKLCLLGFTNPELAKFFEVNTDTISEWMKVHPGFSDAIRAGKDSADSKMAAAMYKSGIGEHFVAEEKIIYNDGVAEIVTLKKQLPPDVKAQIHWLNNRQSKNWRNNIIVDKGANLDADTISFLSGEFEDRLRAIRENAAKLREERGITINGQ